MVIKEAIAELTSGKDLEDSEAETAMQDIMEGHATAAQIGAFLAALKLKGETMKEILGCARAMRAKATPLRHNQEPIDLCGTGGDGAKTFNVSTTSSFVVAGCGIPVAKHGNRSVSSNCGSADVLEALGINIKMEPGEAESCLKETGIAFLFAPIYHGAMKHASGPRKELGLRTIFNLLGPLCNPADVQAQVVGVYAPHLTDTLALVLDALGTRHSLVLHSLDGLDEISVSAPTRISEAKDGTLRTYLIDPKEVGIRPAPKDALAGLDARFNASILVSVLKGERSPARDMVLLNAAAGLIVGGVTSSFTEAVRIAGEAIDSGAALEKLHTLQQFSGGKVS